MPIVILKGPAGSEPVSINLDTFEIEVLQNPLVTAFKADAFHLEISDQGVIVRASAIWKNQVRRSVTAPIILVEIELDDEMLVYTSQDTELSSGEFFEGRVMQFGTISRSVSNTSGNFEISDVTLILANTDGKLSEVSFSGWLNRTVSYYMGFKGYTRSEFMRIFKGIISDFKFTGTLFEVTITDSTRLWLDQDYGTLIDPVDFPFAAQGVAGTRMPIIYGEMTGHF
ncbi:MAG: hypothetical protein KJ737_16660 [Proteobacteria bacterium]|nr:hypothetical protein [Pseudomonadota bacterium]